MMPKLTPNLWFDKNAELAANFYVSIFPNSRVTNVNRSPADFPSGKAGDVVTVDWELDGHPFTGINGGPDFRFNESISFVVHCESQEEVDHYWSKLSDGGDPKAQQCGWLKDRFGVSWQIVATILVQMLGDQDREKANRVMRAMLGMKKIDIAELRKAYGT